MVSMILKWFFRFNSIYFLLNLTTHAIERAYALSNLVCFFFSSSCMYNFPILMRFCEANLFFFLSNNKFKVIRSIYWEQSMLMIHFPLERIDGFCFNIGMKWFWKFCYNDGIYSNASGEFPFLFWQCAGVCDVGGWVVWRRWWLDCVCIFTNKKFNTWLL